MARRSWILSTVFSLTLACDGGKPTGADAQAKAADPAPAAAASGEAPAAVDSALLDPFEANATAPETYRVKLDTTKGDVVIEVRRDWAPNGARRAWAPSTALARLREAGHGQLPEVTD